MNDISLIEEKAAGNGNRKSLVLPLTLALFLNACTTLPHQVNKQTSTLSSALNNERQLQSKNNQAALALAKSASDSLKTNPSQSLKIVAADIAQIQALLASNSKPEIAAQKQTDTALAKLDRTAKSAANLAQEERADSSYFGLPGLINHAWQVAKNSLFLFLSLALASAGLYIASYFFPVLGPIIALAESALTNLLSQLQKLKR